MPSESLKTSPVATETAPRKSIKERLGMRVRGVAAPPQPTSDVTATTKGEEGRGQEGEQEGEILGL